MSSEAPAGACRNCGSPAPGAYCPACGQETAPHPPTAREFLHEFFSHYIALEGALWRSLRALFPPGHLTLEYFEGRKRRYVHPLRLYLAASLLFFVVAKALAPQAQFRVVTLDQVAAGTATTAARGVTMGCKTDSEICRTIQARLKERYGDLSQERLAGLMRDRLVSLSPYAMFFLLPVFALITRLAYWRRPRNYGEHLVFAFHVHTFAFLVGTVAAIAGYLIVETAAAAVYLALALGRVFGGRRWAHLARFVLIFVVYFAIVIATVVGLAALALFS